MSILRWVDSFSFYYVKISIILSNSKRLVDIGSVWGNPWQESGSFRNNCSVSEAAEIDLGRRLTVFRPFEAWRKKYRCRWNERFAFQNAQLAPCPKAENSTLRHWISIFGVEKSESRRWHFLYFFRQVSGGLDMGSLRGRSIPCLMFAV